MGGLAALRDRPRTALVCDYDPIWLSSAKSRVRQAGFEVLGEATNVVDALHRSSQLRPSLIVVTNEHSGLTALEAIPEFRQQTHRPEVLVLSTSQVDRQVFLARGALLLVGRLDPDGFEDALAEATEYLRTGERRKRPDRRDGVDRRTIQDWTKVTSERRRGDDRRQVVRRNLALPRRQATPAAAAAAATRATRATPATPAIAGAAAPGVQVGSSAEIEPAGIGCDIR